MRRGIRRIKGVGFIIWHSKHELMHVLLGLMYAWYLREQWNEFNARWITLAIVGSLLPDLDHFIYFLGYGKKEAYTKQVLNLITSREWRKLFVFVESGHKYQTSLSYHNYYFTGILLCMGLLSSFIEWKVGVILFGAMVIHYFFDISEDLIIFRKVNPNWKRWGNGRVKTSTSKRLSRLELQDS